ncbi:MAG: hypothetical protein RMI94_15705 [Bryobacterales bacterium]|nr:hypothetical protein [Bryobacteraceae bacterium]MDW8131994.1 hypothetical protein [Bryobacterales bacterium]
MKLTRRELAGLLGGPAAALSQQTHTPPPEDEQLLAAARDRVRRNSQALAGVPIPPETEPAFQFRAS